MAHVVESQSLYYTGGTSNKEYHLYLLQLEDGRYSVHAEYGPRHRVRQNKDYGTYPAAASAKHRYRLILDEKLKKGYQHDRDPRAPTMVPSREPLRPSPAAAGPDLAALTATATTLLAEVAMFDDGNETVAEAQQALVAALGTAGMTFYVAVPGQCLLMLLSHYALGAQDYVEDALAWCVTADRQELLAGVEPELRIRLQHKSPQLNEFLDDAIAMAGLPKRMARKAAPPRGR